MRITDMPRFQRKIICQALLCGLFAGTAGGAPAQDAPVTDEDATVTYPASFFTQYEPFSVNDMLDRIPGINIARQGGGGPGFSGGNNRRGLGMGGDQVLINGRRIAGKENGGSSQLARIPASQVDYIEIIRGTSGDLDVRGGNQVVNIVLLEAETRSSIAYEINTDHYHDDSLKPGGKIAWSGSRGGFDYLVSAESEPRHEHRIGHETSVLGDGSPNERIKRVSTRKAQPMVISSNLAWQVGDADLFHLNLQYEDDSAPEEARRDILDTRVDVSTPTQILSANGNIGDGERYGIALDGSYRFTSMADSQILLTSGLRVEDSSVIDPFLGIDRRFSRQGRGSARIGFRHDFPARNFNYGFSWNHNFRDGRIAYDIDKIEDYNSGDFVRLFAETQGWGELIYRFEVFNPFENARCRVRSRYLGGTIATGYVSEIEDSCSHIGPTIAIKIRGTI